MHNSKKFVAFLLLMLATRAHAITIETTKSRTINAITASADYTGAAINAGTALNASFQCSWASLTGSLDGTFQVEVSNNSGTNWTTKSAAAITVSGATGADMISLNGVVTEESYHIKWTHNNVSGGTVNCYAVFKG